MSESTDGPKGQPIRSDQWQPPRGSRAVRADNDARHGPQAGEYGEGAAQESTGVGPRRAAAEPQVLNDRPGHPDNYGNVASGVYGAHGYSGEPGHPSAYAADSGVPGAVGQPRADSTSDAQSDASQGAGGSQAVQSADALSDDRLRELIRERLTEDPEIDATDVTIDVQAGSVTLTGSVQNERTRDVVEQCVENCGARTVHNRLSVA
ncbi:MAG TPA: BON domain-containing protein [Steroidobacteraceae bacterium]|nr:BON domain-containing protein [Steroidobacteraceae bacterium]